MKIRKRAILIISAVLLMAAGFVYYDTVLIKNTVQTAEEQQGTEAGGGGQVQAGTGIAADSPADDAEDTVNAAEQTQNNMYIRTESVTVEGNTPEYELKLELYENPELKTGLRLEYYRDGIGAANELDEGQLPELSGLFENREKEQGDSGSYKIGQALLNPVHGQLYILIQGAPLDGFYQSSLYSVDLADMSLKKLFSYPGLFGRMSFNSDFSLLAYSFADSPLMSNYQQDSLLEVYDCKNGEYIVKGSLLEGPKMIGINSSPDMLYDYEFTGWRSPAVLKLIRGGRPKSAPDSKQVRTDVLYDIEKNILLNTDGGELKQDNAVESEAVSSINSENAETVSNGSAENAAEGSGPEGKDSEGIDPEGKDPAAVNKPDSEPLKTLKDFYSYLSSEADYGKAMDMLDDGFVLRMEMLRQFGIEQVTKKEIDAEYEADNAALYSGVLKAARLDAVTGESIEKDGSVVFTFYQLLGLSPDSQVRQLMSARLAKTDNGWKIIYIEDGE